MQIPVLVESLGADRYRAEAPSPFAFSAEGRSSEEAVQKLREKMAASVANGKQLVAVEVPSNEEHPWMPYVGQFEHDPLYDKWQEAIAEYRRQQAAEEPA
jgi:hypothetical protein